MSPGRNQGREAHLRAEKPGRVRGVAVRQDGPTQAPSGSVGTDSRMGCDGSLRERLVALGIQRVPQCTLSGEGAVCPGPGAACEPVPFE